jgi:hypothetical protein
MLNNTFNKGRKIANLPHNGPDTYHRLGEKNGGGKIIFENEHFYEIRNRRKYIINIDVRETGYEDVR